MNNSLAREQEVYLSRIAAVFNKLKEEGKKGFIPFITAGDPDLRTTLQTHN